MIVKMKSTDGLTEVIMNVTAEEYRTIKKIAYWNLIKLEKDCKVVEKTISPATGKVLEEKEVE